MATLLPGYQSVPEYLPDEKEHRRKLARAINQNMQGKFNAFIDFTLNANASSSIINDARIGFYSTLIAVPQTANASAEIGNGTMYIPQPTMMGGKCTIQHANNSQTDRTFRFLIIG